MYLICISCQLGNVEQIHFTKLRPEALCSTFCRRLFWTLEHSREQKLHDQIGIAGFVLLLSETREFREAFNPGNAAIAPKRDLDYDRM